MKNTIKSEFIFVLILLGFGIKPVLAQLENNTNRTIKILSFNILHGATTKGDFDLDAIAKVIKDCDPDFVALQEVDYKTKRAKGYDLATELGWRSKMAPLFGKAMSYDGGEYGEGVLSKASILSSRNVALPYSEGKEPRAALEIVTTLRSNDTIAFIGTHLDHTKLDKDRVDQVKKINEVFSQNSYPSILAGDLNDVPESEAIKTLEKVWTPSYDKENPAPTFPSTNPRVKIDYIMFYPKNKWEIIETRVINDTIASDHCAYLVTARLLTN